MVALNAEQWVVWQGAFSVKHLRIFWLLALLPLLVGGCFSSSSEPSQPFTVTISIPTSNAQQTPATTAPVNAIILEFSEPIDARTVDGNVLLQVVKAGLTLVLPENPLEIVVDGQAPYRVIIRTKNGGKLPSGQLYQITVRTGLLAASGRAMAQDIVRFFATDYDFAMGAIPELSDTRSVIVVISDIHLGDARSINEGYGWFIRNRNKLIGFLNLIRQKSYVKELVIAGDLFDEWVAPMDHEPLDNTDESGFVDLIAAANIPVIDAINGIIQDGLIKVTYVPGNHDMLVQSADIQRIFPGIQEARDAQGLGAYAPDGHPEIVIEHGHRYDFFNGPDMISNRDITQTDSILPPGFFVTKIATTSDMEHNRSSFYRQDLTDAQANEAGSYYLPYWAAWELIMSQKPVNESWDDKIIKTGIDGYTAEYAINDLIPQYKSSGGPLDVNLYKGIVDNWNQREVGNQVPVSIPAEVAIAAGAFNPAMDAQSSVQYFLNTQSDKRIVVFGHTHHVELLSVSNHQGLGSIYANSGAWVDNANPFCTFVAIFPQINNGAVTTTVTTYQYVDDNNIVKIKSGVIVD
jgi:UDP-2,3-diacylglucosamine pyrophosphatase LpxH